MAITGPWFSLIPELCVKMNVEKRKKKIFCSCFGIMFKDNIRKLLIDALNIRSFCNPDKCENRIASPGITDWRQSPSEKNKVSLLQK